MENYNLKFKVELNERIYQYVKKIICFTATLQKNMSAQVIVKQLIRSASSIGANIIEAQAGSSKKDFINFMHHSLKSANESLYWMRLLMDTNKIQGDTINYLLQETKEIGNILGASLLRLKGRK